MLQVSHAHHHQHTYHAKEQNHKNLPGRGDAKSHTYQGRTARTKDKGKGKIVDVTNIASSSTSMTSMPRTSTIKWVVRPKVVTQEPTVGKTTYLNKKPQPTEARTEPQEPTPAKGVEP